MMNWLWSLLTTASKYKILDMLFPITIISFAGPFRVSEALLLGITRTFVGWLVGWVGGWLVGPERFNPLPVGGSLPNLHGR